MSKFDFEQGTPERPFSAYVIDGNDLAWEGAANPFKTLRDAKKQLEVTAPVIFAPKHFCVREALDWDDKGPRKLKIHMYRYTATELVPDRVEILCRGRFWVAFTELLSNFFRKLGFAK